MTGDNVVYNDTATREIHMVATGKNSTRGSVLIKGYRCAGSCLGDITEVPIETGFRRWSDPNSWDEKKVPANLSNVEVQSGWNMLYDMAETDPPTIYTMVQVNGRLTFEDADKDLTLRAKYLFVRSGELIIGNQTIPFQKNANIILHGEKASEQITYDNAIEAGNKVLANTANVSFVGKPRSRMSRLIESAYPGATTIKVETGLDWKVGDELALPSSTLRPNDTDDNIRVVSYVSSTGVVTLDKPLKAYHYGGPATVPSNYNGVDIRNEVYLLTRNIKIQGTNSEAWGC